ncbi:MAG: CIA30 family protein, partial [Chloroflexi bacterium]|nr:CIA30 family protein [Chloroflexota bacterium]
MIANDGVMYLADFGLSRIAEACESTMSSDSIMGTPQYISPEQAMGKNDVDAGTDIYSFGVMLYEMVVGQVPFSADTPFSIIHDHIYTPLPLPRKVNPKVPEPVQRVLLKALAKDRLDRYETVEDLVKAFKSAWAEAGTPMQGTAITMRVAAQNAVKAESAPPTPIPEKQSTLDQPKPKKKTSLWVWVGIGLTTLFCCALAFVIIRNNNRRVGPQAPDNPPTLPPVIQPTALPPQPTNTGGNPPIVPVNMIDDFEGAPPANTSGWEAYFQDGADTKIKCEANSEFAYEGSMSLLMHFDIPALSWATCGFYYDRVIDWSDASGIAFLIRSDRVGLVFDVALYGGTPDKRSTHIHHMETPPGSESAWIPVKIPWGEILRAEWEDNPGTPFNPSEVTGFSIGFSDTMPEPITGAIWLDNLGLTGGIEPASGLEPSVSDPAVQEAAKLVEQNPSDPNAHLQLSFALWDTKQVRPAMEELTEALNLAGPDNMDFLLAAAGEFRKREAWAAVTGIYLRAAPHYESTGGMPEDVKTNFHEAVYKSSQIKEPQTLDPMARIDAIDPQLGHIARARQALFNGSLDKAKLQLAEAEKIEPTIHEIALLKAEIAMKEGNLADAKNLLTALVSDPATPEWIRFMAENHLKTIQ